MLHLHRLEDEERRLAGALMRVNHVGEVCAQALYNGQALTARNPATEAALREAVAAATLAFIGGCYSSSSATPPAERNEVVVLRVEPDGSPPLPMASPMLPMASA